MSVTCVISSKNMQLGNRARSYITSQSDKLEEFHPHVDYSEVHLWKHKGQFFGMLRVPLPQQANVSVSCRSRSLGQALRGLFQRGQRMVKVKREKQTDKH